jgi:hypothetical protein
MPRVIQFDIAAKKPERAIRFYEKVFGWRIRKASGPLDYWLVETGSADREGINGGILPRRAEWQRITMIVDVDSAERAAEKVVEAGGVVLQTRTVIPGVGYEVTCRDTEGNAFAVLQFDETAGF